MIPRLDSCPRGTCSHLRGHHPAQGRHKAKAKLGGKRSPGLPAARAPAPARRVPSTGVSSLHCATWDQTTGASLALECLGLSCHHPHPIHVKRFRPKCRVPFMTSLCVSAKSLQSCPTLCDPMDCSTRLLCPRGSPGKNAGMGCHALLQGIFLTQG